MTRLQKLERHGVPTLPLPLRPIPLRPIPLRHVMAGLLLAAAMGTLACDPGGPTCAAGTTENDQGVCEATEPVPTAPDCGPGTVQQGNTCVAADAGAATTCGVGTERVDGGCIPMVTPPPTCGTGTEEVNGNCVPIAVDAGSPPQTCEPACGLGTYCGPSLACIPTPRPGSWTCFAENYGDGDVCDCECGGFDPDCANPALPVDGCVSNQCQDDGTCVACVPQCAGKQCGDDGCGQSCGLCSAPGLNRCASGTCVACVAQCNGRQCGDDGCGGTCGECTAGKQCQLGQCESPPITSSCLVSCGQIAPDGCSCQGGCEEAGDCCVDVGQCGCLPNCADRNCGDDGCGGTCGSCLDAEICSAQQICISNPCNPNPCSAFGTCREVDGSCACAAGYVGAACEACAQGFSGYPNCVFDQCALSGETCNGNGTCVPATGFCACDSGFTGTRCEACATDAGVLPNCQP